MTERPKVIFSFGEILWDLMPDGARLGGAPYNLACRISALGDHAVPVSRLGTDDLGRRAYEQGLSAGLDMSHVQWDERHATGTVQVTFDRHGCPDYVIATDVAFDHIGAPTSALEIAARCDGFCFGTVAQRAEVSRQACRALLSAASEATKLLDVNLRKRCYTREIVVESLNCADIVKLNEAEIVAVGGMLGWGTDDAARIAAALLERFTLECCVVTLAERGVFAVASSGESVRVRGFPISFVDPLGAGDAFTAGFLCRYLRGAPLVECCTHGNAMGALAASLAGATAPIPAKEIEEMIALLPLSASEGVV